MFVASEDGASAGSCAATYPSASSWSFTSVASPDTPVVLNTAMKTPWTCGLGTSAGCPVVPPVGPDPPVGAFVDPVPSVAPVPPPSAAGGTPPPPAEAPSGDAWVMMTMPPTTRAEMRTKRIVLVVTGLPSAGVRRHPTHGRGARPSARSLRGRPSGEAPSVTQTPESPHDHRVVRQRLGQLDRPHEQLVVAGRRHAQPLADQPRLATARRRPTALEVQDGPGSIVERTHAPTLATATDAIRASAGEG